MIHLLLVAELSPCALKSTGPWDHLQQGGLVLPNRLREKTAKTCNPRVTGFPRASLLAL